MSTEVPRGWANARIGDVCDSSQYGFTAKAKEAGNVHFLRTTDITSGEIDWKSVPYCDVSEREEHKYLLKDGDVVISRAGSVGYSHLLRNPERSVFASYLIRFRPLVSADYFSYFLQTPGYWQAISEQSLGIAVQNVNATKLADIEIPVAPASEQTRIVEKLEELLSDLDAGVAELKAAQRKLAQYRQSLLKAAVEGALTADWRARRPSPSPQPLPHQGGGAKTAEAAEARAADNAGRDAAMTQNAARPSASATARERSPRPPSASGNSAPLSPRGRGVGGEGANHGNPPSPALLRQRARDMRHEPTPQEHQLWQHLRAKRFAGYKFRRQQPIGRYIVDFVCFAERLIVELDGGQHADAGHYDAERDTWLQGQGFRVLRFWNNDWAQHTDAVLDAIWAALQGEASAAPPPLPNPSPARGEGLESETGAELLQRILRERRARWEQKQLAKFAEQSKTPPKGWQEKYPEPVTPDLTDLPPLPEGWVWASLDMLGEIASGVAKGTKRDSGVVVREVPYLRVANVQRGYLDLREIKVIEATEKDIKELRLLTGDVLFNEGGDLDKLGRGWIWRGEVAECIYQNHVFRMRPFLSEIPAEFISHHGNSFGKEWFKKAGKQTTNLASINMTMLRAFPVPVPPASEGSEIVVRLESLLRIAAEQEKSVEQALIAAAAQRKNILKAAFSGQLVPQDPNDEPASELLARIRAQREANADTPARKRGRKAKGAA